MWGKIREQYVRFDINTTILFLVDADVEMASYEHPGFLSKFIELNKVMWNVNKGLTKSHPYDSRPQVCCSTKHVEIGTYTM